MVYGKGQFWFGNSDVAKQQPCNLTVDVDPPTMGSIGIGELDPGNHFVVWPATSMLPLDTAALIHDVGKQTLCKSASEFDDWDFLDSSHASRIPPTAAHQGADLHH